MEKRAQLVYLAVILALVAAVAFLGGVIYGGSRFDVERGGKVSPQAVVAQPLPKAIDKVESSQSKERPNQWFDADFIKSVKNRATGYGMHPNWYLVLVRSANESGVSEAHLDAMIRSMIWNLELAGRGRSANVARAFRVMGAAPEELSVIGTDGQFMAIARMFKDYKGIESRFALATEIFSGAATSECVAFLCQGDEPIRSNYAKFKSEGSLLTDEQLGEKRQTISSLPAIPNFGEGK